MRKEDKLDLTGDDGEVLPREDRDLRDGLFAALLREGKMEFFLFFYVVLFLGVLFLVVRGLCEEGGAVFGSANVGRMETY